MLKESILCEFIVSPLNTQLLYCKHCNRAIEARNYNDSMLCPVLVTQRSQQPDSGVRLINKQIPQTLEEFKNLIPDIQHIQEKEPIETTCSQQQIDERLAICTGCEFYENNSCLQCGCILSRERNYMNKLYRADQACPIGKWGPVNS